MEREERGSESEAGWHDSDADLFGPRAWTRILSIEGARCRRYERTATVVVIEVPELDDVTRAWGDDVRAVAVSGIGRALRSAARSSDHVARTDERRFAVLLPETDEVAAVNFVERARSRCEAVLADITSERCRFGWADARPSRSLDAAAALASSRVGSDR